MELIEREPLQGGVVDDVGCWRHGEAAVWLRERERESVCVCVCVCVMRELNKRIFKTSICVSINLCVVFLKIKLYFKKLYQA